MSINKDKRREFIKAGLAIPLLGGVAVIEDVLADQSSNKKYSSFVVPERIQQDIQKLYGDDANTISYTDRITINTAEIAENSAVIPISIKGEKGLVSSIAVLVEQNPEPLTSVFTLHDGADLAVSIRIKASRSSDVYVIAKTQGGLLGVMRRLKVTMGCMGG